MQRIPRVRQKWFQRRGRYHDGPLRLAVGAVDAKLLGIGFPVEDHHAAAIGAQADVILARPGDGRDVQSARVRFLRGNLPAAANPHKITDKLCPGKVEVVPRKNRRRRIFGFRVGILVLRIRILGRGNGHQRGIFGPAIGNFLVRPAVFLGDLLSVRPRTSLVVKEENASRHDPRQGRGRQEPGPDRPALLLDRTLNNGGRRFDDHLRFAPTRRQRRGCAAGHQFVQQRRLFQRLVQRSAQAIEQEVELRILELAQLLKQRPKSCCRKSKLSPLSNLFQR